MGLFTGLYGFYLECWFRLCSCFSLDFFLVSFCFMAGIWSVCVVVLWVWWGMGKDRRRKEIIVIIIFLYLTVCWDCVRGGMGEGGFLCGGIVRCVLAGLCVGHCVLSSCLWGVLWPSRAFSRLDRVFICLSRESASEWIFGPFSVFPCLFLSVLLIFLTFCRFV